MTNIGSENMLSVFRTYNNAVYCIYPAAPWLMTCAPVLSMLDAGPQHTQDVDRFQAQCVYWAAAKFHSRYTGMC